MAPFRTPAGSSSPTARHPCHTGFDDAQSDQILGHGVRSSRTSWGRRLTCYSRWMDRRCARSPQIPPRCPRFHPSPSRTLSTCLTSVLTVRCRFGRVASDRKCPWLCRMLCGWDVCSGSRPRASVPNVQGFSAWSLRIVLFWLLVLLCVASRVAHDGCRGRSGCLWWPRDGQTTAGARAWPPVTRDLLV